jgi:glycosyltransferase involved in cell wall biosynthesis
LKIRTGKKSKRVALLLGALTAGGVERVMLNLAEAFCERKLRVDLVVTRAEGEYAGRVPAGVRVFDLRAKRVLAAIPALVRYLRSAHPDAILSAQKHVNCIAVGARELAGLDTRLLLSIHSNLSQNTKNATTITERLLPTVMRWCYPRADRVVAVSRGVAEDLAAQLGFRPESIDVVHNPVVKQELPEQADRPVSHSWFRTGAPPVILGVGRLTPAKDFGTLIRAFARVRKRFDHRLVILGEGPERGRLEGIIEGLGLSKCADLPGYVDNPYAYMSRAAVCVLSSRWEGFGNVLVEAMACGTPVVATDCRSGPREILEDGKWGRLVPPENPEALGKAIIHTVKKPREGTRRRSVDFSVDRIADRYHGMLFAPN